jgi:hypothetical protein
LQRVTDAKTFKAAKKKLGIMSRRDGFGRDGEWSWAFPASLTVDTADITPEVPTSVIYADYSRPVRSGNAARLRPLSSWQNRAIFLTIC